MKPIARIAGWLVGSLLCACASTVDHFYTLRILPEGASPAATAPSLHILLSVNLPTLVDRDEMIIDTSDTGIRVLDHQRWAVPLSDQVWQTLARDIEKRRSDILIGDRGFERTTSQPIVVKVDIVRISAHLGGRATVEAHWRIVDATAGMDQIGDDSFDAPLGVDYCEVPEAYSQVLNQLAGKLANAIRSG